ncbi:XRE family transcriptional regulator [Streptomonospora sediminis]
MDKDSETGSESPASDDTARRTGAAKARNEVQGETGSVVQAGAIHGGVHFAAASSAGAAVPRQLPLAITGFVNRNAEISRLDALAQGSAVHETPDDATGSGGAVVVSVIGGSPGVGKTALAVRWAHRVRARYPDGDLYVNMRGHGPGPRLDASAALGSLLQALDVPPDRIPIDLDSRASLYRTRLAGKRVLVLIDDAVSPDQVRPLLPASPTCLVLVTSRSTLAGLVTREGARRMDLDTLSTEDSLALLRRHVDSSRIDSEPEAARTLVAHCARLPLALRVLAERLLSGPATALDDVVAELGAENERLDALGTAEDELSDVRAVFATSYAALSPGSARLFRCLGIHPGPDFAAAACAAAAAASLRRVRPLIDELTRANLMQRTGRDRYRMHDLLRAYAAERFHAEEEPGEADEVLGRTVRWYLRTATSAVLSLAPRFRPAAIPGYELPGDGSSAEPLEFEDLDAALGWFEGERANLVRSVQAAYDRGLHDLAWRVPANISGLFELHRHWHEWLEIQRLGLESAQLAGHREGQARNHLALATVNRLLGNTGTALEHYAEARDTARGEDARIPWIEGFALRQLGALRWERDRDSEGLALIGEAIDVFRAAGDRRGEGMALLSLAEYERSIGRTGAALEHCRSATTLLAGTGERWSIAFAHRSLAAALASAGEYAAAVDEYGEALRIFQALEDRSSEALALTGMGEALAARGETGRARRCLGAALDILHAFGDDCAAEVEAAIARLG